MYRDTDGYIIIDLKGIDVSRASQSVPGLYEKVEPVLDANKLVIVNNAGNHTPLPGSCIKASNYIRITTDIYIFTINSNNILIIEANGSSITVDVSIIPAYSEGTKIADFEINGQSGELYIPAYPDIINDSVASDHTVYSSDKVNTLLSGKADTSSIPTKTSDLDNDSGFITSSDIPAIPDDLNDLSDVDISSASDAQVLTFDAISGKWVNATSPSGVTSLSHLSDVTIASASDGNVLTYDSTSSKWVNADVEADAVSYDNTSSGLTATDVQAAIDEVKGDIITNITDLSDVSLTTPVSGNALIYDGTEWVNDTLDAADIPYSAGVSVADKLDSLTPEDVSSSVTKYTNIDYFEKSVVRSGNVVCVYISFSFSSTPTANNIIAENLPKAAANMLLLCECTSGSNNGKAARVMVNSLGRVLDWYTTGFFGTGMNYSIIGSYITNDPI